MNLVRFLAISLVVAVLPSAEEEVDCSDNNGYSLPCNPDIDPWKNTRTKMDTLTNQVDPPDSDLWSRLTDAKETVETIVETPEKLSEAAKATSKAAKAQTKQAAAAATETVEEVAEQAKGAKKWLQRATKVLSVLSAAAQFAGPIIDIILLFAPVSKSEELTAIESGFAKVGAKIDSVSYQLNTIHDALDWNAVVGILIEFEASVHHTTIKYNALVEEVEAMDSTQEMPLAIKNQIEDLVNAIRSPGRIGSSLQLVDSIFKGTSGFTNGNTLLETFVLATDNDCSKILPMAFKLMQIVKDAQRLQYFYEINQQLVSANDDKGYPKMLYDMYTESMTSYSKCTRNAATYAQDEMKVRHGGGDSILDIIDEMEPKYDLYNWAAMKEFKKEDDFYAIIDNCGSKRDVELTGISEDEQEEQRLTLYGVKKSSKTQVEDAIARIRLVLVDLVKADLPVIPLDKMWGQSAEYRMDLLLQVRALLEEKDDVLKSLIQSNRLTMVMFLDDAQIDLYGWHYKSNMEIIQQFPNQGNQGNERYTNFTLGFMFSFKDTSSFTCINGIRKEMSFEGSHPHCICNMDYGDTACNMYLKEQSTSPLSNDLLDLIQIYKVPGMFDLQNDVKTGTETIMNELENNKQEIFEEIRKTGTEMEKLKNAILSAQSVMLNDIKAGNAVVLKEVAGLREAMEAAFERERNDRIYQTEKGNKIVVGTIKVANRKVTDDINRLTGEVITNRYFKELKLHIPVFQRKFERALDFGGYAEEDFSEYLRLHEQDFLTSKEAARLGITNSQDSFVTAQMRVNMKSGCTTEYTEMIDLTWNEMFELNLAVSTMQMWDLEYRIQHTDDPEKIEFYKFEQSDLKKLSKIESAEMKAVYESRSCPAFSHNTIIGGGCGKATSYPGQIIPVKCTDERKTLVLGSIGQAVTDLVCEGPGKWAVDVKDFACVNKCYTHYNIFNDIGETRPMPVPPPGYYFTDGEGNPATYATCLAPAAPGWNAPTEWMSVPEGISHDIFMIRASLEIRTQSIAGSGDLVHVHFLGDSMAPAGGLMIHFSEPMQYQLERCQTAKAQLTNVPATADKVWAITKEESSSTIKIACNGVSVGSLELSQCTDTGKAVYKRAVSKVLFVADDTASTAYRIKKIQDCVEDSDTRGVNYRGLTNVTGSGRECQRWDSQTPNKHKGTPSRYPWSGLVDNYCRNPDNDWFTWCYNNEGVIPRWEVCGIPRCSVSNERMIRSLWSVTHRRDIDECATPGYCRFGGTCTNTDGSFECACPTGFTNGADGRCEDVNECNAGNEGFEKCLVQANLGMCSNTEGSYTCTCLSGSWSPVSGGGKVCQECACDDNGIKSTVCDVNTGSCLCKTNVVGTRCDACRAGIASFPICTRCAAGYFSYPACVQCNCASAGVTDQHCNPSSGVCLCKPGVGGSRCEQCKTHYKDYPSCVPDVKHGTLSEWGTWSPWVDQGQCGPSYAEGYNQKRTRTRTCDDSTKNTHGQSCAHASLTQSESKYLYVCAQVTEVYINLPNYYHAGTTADLWLGIKQGSNSCTTTDPTWHRPGDGATSGAGTYHEDPSGCTNTFDKTKDVDLYLYSDSDNDVYIKFMGLIVGGVYKTWYSPGSYTSINHDTNNGWYTAT